MCLLCAASILTILLYSFIVFSSFFHRRWERERSAWDEGTIFELDGFHFIFMAECKSSGNNLNI